MSTPLRRRSDPALAVSAHEIPGRVDGVPDVETWLQRCAARIVQVDAHVPPAEAQEIARTMLSFERTGVMEPEAAVDFVVAELGVASPRFERRSLARALQR